MNSFIKIGVQYVSQLEVTLGVTDLELLFEKPLIHGNFIYRGTVDGRKCAVKFSVDDPDSIRSEYECAKRLCAGLPEHIVKPIVYKDVGRGAAYISDWVEGIPLHVYLASDDFPMDEIDDIVRQLDKITEYFLANSFAHRDFCSPNIIRNADGRLIVIDFQNSCFVGEKDLAANKALREIRSHIYIYRSVGFGVGTFNDRSHFLLDMERHPELYKALMLKWGGELYDSCLHFKVNPLKYIYIIGNLPMLLLKRCFSRSERAKLKVSKKLDTTFNTLKEFLTGRNWR